ncbi:ATP-dependent RNA helicase, partial [Tulasnella sp. 427]
METVTVRAKPPKRLLLKRKRLLGPSRLHRPSLDEPQGLGPSDLLEDADEEPGDQSRKRRKLKADGMSVDTLPWRSRDRPQSSTFDSDAALMSVEVVDDVDIVYLDEAKKRVSYSIKDKGKSRGQTSTSTETPSNSLSVNIPPDPPGFHSFNAKSLLPEWEPLQLKGCLNRAMHKLGFQSPTEIQKQAIPTVIRGRDVIGVAETGSGKTLAFGLPILQLILSNPPQPTPRPLIALILTPTRELAIQVADHLNVVASNLYPKSQDKKLKPGQPKPPPRVSVGAIVGGIDNHKQMRVIKRGMDIM